MWIFILKKETNHFINKSQFIIITNLYIPIRKYSIYFLFNILGVTTLFLRQLIRLTVT